MGDLPLINFHVSLSIVIPGRRNCKIKTHLPAKICTCFLFMYLCTNNHNVAWITLVSFCVEIPRVCVFPSTSAPSSPIVEAAVTRFFSELITPAAAHAASAVSWQSWPLSVELSGNKRSPAAKLSKYTWNHGFSCSRASSTMQFIQGGNNLFLLTMPVKFIPPQRIKFSEISCIIPTLFNQPIGITLQHKANCRESEKPKSEPEAKRLKQRCGFHIPGSRNR